nr:tryptophan dimethylallyltransferase family protein [Sandaracinus amylolyticus]
MKQYKRDVEHPTTDGVRVIHRAHAQGPSLVDFGARRLEALCLAAGFESATSEVVDTFRALLAPWGDRPLHHRTSSPDAGFWVSDISDDNTPIELSAAIAAGEVEVRVLLEAQAEEPTLPAHRAAAIALTERLERDHGADLSRFRVVQDLFLPDDMHGPFALWHSAVFRRGRPPAFKAYFNPQAYGRGRAQSVVEEALHRLGFDGAWGSLCRTARRGPHLDELKYFALDLVADPKARVKVYVRHHDATAADLEAACSGAESYTPGEVHEFVRAMGGDRERLAARATFTCSALVEGSVRPAATTVYVPICAYAPDDLAVQQRVHAYLVEHGMDPAPYDALVHGYAERPLDAGVGMQSWVAFRRHHDDPRLTVYLATEAAKVHPRGSVPAATGDRLAFASGEAVLRTMSEYDVADHPLVRRLSRGEDATHELLRLTRELCVGLATQRARWVATAGASADAPETRDALELDLARIDAALDARASTRDGFGEELDELLAGRIGPADAIEAIAALLACDAAVQQLLAMIDACGATSLASAPTDAHAALARSVPTARRAIASMRSGAMSVHSAIWEWLDDRYVERFGARS